MTGAPSLRRTLTLAVIAIVGVALATMSFTVYGLLADGSRRRFDERLAETARAAALLARRDGPPATDLPADLQPTVDQSRGATSYQVWSEDGSLLTVYPPLSGTALRLPDTAGPRYETVRLPDGGAGRLYRAWLGRARAADGSPHLARVGVAVLRDTVQLEERLARLRATLWATTLGTMLMCGVVAWLVIRRSLRAVAAVSHRITSIDPSSARERLVLDALPDELRPPFAKVNELLDRVEQVLGRERQFSADVSHELRTPLAGLRTILEVSASRERSASEHRASVREALEVVQQLESTVENLLALARLGAGQLGADHREEVDVAALVQACFAPFAGTAARRRVRFDSWVAPGTTVLADRVKLRLVFSNLLSNAAEYTAEGGWITVESAPAEGVVVRVRDSGPHIPEAFLANVFDPFFRLDRSRSRIGEHCGIGLALVRGLCDSSGYRVTAENEAGGPVAFTVTAQPIAGGFPRESADPSAGPGRAAPWRVAR